MDSRSVFLHCCLATIFSLGLSSCGGGSSDENPPPNDVESPNSEPPRSAAPPPPPGPDPAPLSAAKHFVYASKDSGDLFAITSDNLNAPITLATNVTAFQLITAWEYDLEAKTLSNFDNKLVLYAKEGKLYKATLGGDFSSTQVSNESLYCPQETGSFKFGSISVGGFEEAGASWSGYTSAGIDSECGTVDDQHRLVQLNMDENTSPVIPPGIELADIFNADTGLLDGWLLTNTAGKLIRTHANFEAPVVIAGAPESSQWIHLEETGSLNLLEDRDSHTLYLYDESNGEFSTLVDNFHASEVLIDTAAIYWLDPTDHLIKTSSFNGTGASLAPDAEKLITLTDDYLIYRSNVNGHYFSVLKTGSVAIEIFAPKTLGTLISGKTNLLYANNITLDPESTQSQISAHIIQASNGHLERSYPHAQWIGGSIANTLSLADDNPFTFEHMLLVQRTANENQWTDYSGGTLLSVEASSMNIIGELGTIPTEKRLDTAFGLASSSLTVDSHTPTDIFYLDTARTGSLQRITQAVDDAGYDTNSF